MDRLSLESNIYVHQSSLGGRGVFSNVDFEPGEIIEFCPMLVLPAKDRPLIDQTIIYDYYFEWGAPGEELAIALGFGSIYNHSYEPNAVYETFYEEKMMVIKALRDITTHEEILISYNQDPEDKRRVWFEKK